MDPLSEAMASIAPLPSRRHRPSPHLRPSTGVRRAFDATDSGFMAPPPGQPPLPGLTPPGNIDALGTRIQWHAVDFQGKRSVALAFMDAVDAGDIPFIDRFIRYVAPGLNLTAKECYRMDHELLNEFWRVASLTDEAAIQREQVAYDGARAKVAAQQAAAQAGGGGGGEGAFGTIMEGEEGLGFARNLRAAAAKLKKRPITFFQSRFVNEQVWSAMRHAWSVYMPIHCSSKENGQRVLRDGTDELKDEILKHPTAWEAWALLTVRPVSNRKGAIGGNGRGVTTKDGHYVSNFTTWEDAKAVKALLRDFGL